MQTKPSKSTQCPCGAMITVPFINNGGAGEYDICNLECTDCGRVSTGGNFKTGIVTSWITRKSLNAANAEYQAQCFDADNNEFFGRGNW